MWSPRQRNDVVKLFGRRTLFLLLYICVLGLVSAVWNIAHKARESATLKHEAQVQLADLSLRKAQFSSDIEKLKTGRGKEEVLRREYALAAAGEHLVIIVDPATQPPIAASSSPVMKWIQSFFWW